MRFQRTEVTPDKKFLKEMGQRRGFSIPNVPFTAEDIFEFFA